MTWSHCQELCQQASGPLIGYTKVNNQSNASCQQVDPTLDNDYNSQISTSARLVSLLRTEFGPRVGGGIFQLLMLRAYAEFAFRILIPLSPFSSKVIDSRHTYEWFSKKLLSPPLPN